MGRKRRQPKPKPRPVSPVPVPPTNQTAPRVTLEGFPVGYWGTFLSQAELVAVFQEIWLAHHELNNGVMPYRDFWMVYKAPVYGETRPNEDPKPGMSLGDPFSPALRGRIVWEVPAHEMRHNVMGASWFYYALIERYAFLQEALACAAAVWVLRKALLSTRLTAAALETVRRAMQSECDYQLSRSNLYAANGYRFLVAEDVFGKPQDPRIALTSQALGHYIITLDALHSAEPHKRVSRCFAPDMAGRITFSGDRGIAQVAYIAAVLTAAYGVDARSHLVNTLRFQVNDTLYAQYSQKIQGVL